ncbi:large subunit ribosomal protein L25 [Nocardia transvalensis]|uniref:Large ribosomal subunit protein bL25 n=1 Tax=Nocardia transvalensis TaxID=37333 RepID=A0A7W9UH22_9NOCA|nr:50S ribosomal protein L25/general stress protein Ctc [Nocardia transvalensis]MBB5912721.1 large subunit ribosomal protein L25 [Nocardia transvalensis]
MSDASLLEANVRTEFGKGAARRTRRDGNVPAVLYGHGEAPKHLAVNAQAFAAILREHGTNAVLNLEIDGKKQLALTKSVVVHPIRRYIEHADLLIVKRGEKVVADVHVVLEGDAAPGTLVTQDASTLAVEADALNIPEELTVSIEGAEVGTQITAAQVTLPKGATLAADPETLVVNIVAATAADVAEPESEGETETEGESAE